MSKKNKNTGKKSAKSKNQKHINPPFSTHPAKSQICGTAFADMGTLSQKIPNNILSQLNTQTTINSDLSSPDTPLTSKQKFNLRFSHLNIHFHTDLTQLCAIFESVGGFNTSALKIIEKSPIIQKIDIIGGSYVLY